MALMHFQHKSMGKSTHAKRSATAAVFYITRDGEAVAASVNDRGQRVLSTGKDLATGREQFSPAEEAIAYNTRDSAASVVLAGRMPSERAAASRFLEQAAAYDRSNARICDTFIMALPRELTREQNTDLLRDWCETITHGKAAYYAAIHDKGEDAENPHAHVIIRDRDYSKGDVPEKERGRVIGTTTNLEAIARAQRLGQEPPPRMTTYDLRDAWARKTNEHLRQHGIEATVDARSYKDQGLEIEAGIHKGRAAIRLAEKGIRPISGKDYIAIDNGQTRLDEHEKRKRRRSERPPPDTPEQKQREALNKQHGEDRSKLAALHHAERLALKSLHEAEFKTRCTQDNLHNRDNRNAAYGDIGQQFAARYQEVRSIQDETARQTALAALTKEQAAAYETRSSELIANASPAKDARWRQMQAAQRQERLELQQQQQIEIEARQLVHDTERLALKEQQRQQREAARDDGKLSRQALRDSVALSGSQKMVNVEAIQMQRMRRRAEQVQREADAQTPEALQAKVEQVRANAQRLRKQAKTSKETTDRRAMSQSKLVNRVTPQVDKNPTATKQKGKGDTEQER